MSIVMVLLVVVPLATTIVCTVASHTVAAAVTVVTGVGSLVGAVVLVPAATEHTQFALRYLRADALSVVFLLATCFLYAATSIYAVGYLHTDPGSGEGEAARAAFFAQHSRRFFVGFNAFAWSMICAPLVNGLALLWIAVEITTVVSALLVALENTEGATEAAWKYVLIASSGLGIALLATIFMYYAGSQVLGQSYDLAFDPLLASAAELQNTPVRLAFVLAVVGYGTKVGFFPGAHLVARCARRGADAGVGAVVGIASGREFLRDPALLPDRDRHDGPALPATGPAGVRGVVVVAGRPVSA